ncbi:MAG: hypothetical protein NWF13_06725 [Candidatus Bathyarchaeota archaeon]|nr:hypothetical protein [Candidatus Bathyarchaeota archaeon]
MTAGDILKEANLVIETFTVKANEDVEKGELCVDDGSGILAATAALAATGKVVMALEAHDYSEETDHDIKCVVIGYVEAQKVSGSGAARKGDKLMISATAGEVTKFVKGDAPATYVEADVQTALDSNLGVVGTSMAVSQDADTTQKMFLGVIG